VRYLVILALLAGCATAVPPVFPGCPSATPVPARAPKHPTPKQVAQLEIRVELAYEASARRGDACAVAVEARDRWIRGHR
jgi:hypothetical protein